MRLSQLRKEWTRPERAIAPATVVESRFVRAGRKGTKARWDAVRNRTPESVIRERLRALKLQSPYLRGLMERGAVYGRL